MNDNPYQPPVNNDNSPRTSVVGIVIKVVQLAIGSFFAFASIGTVLTFLREGMGHAGAQFTTELAAVIFVTALFAAISVKLFQSALRKPPKTMQTSGPDDNQA